MDSTLLIGKQIAHATTTQDGLRLHFTDKTAAAITGQHLTVAQQHDPITRTDRGYRPDPTTLPRELRTYEFECLSCGTRTWLPDCGGELNPCPTDCPETRLEAHWTIAGHREHLDLGDAWAN